MAVAGLTILDLTKVNVALPSIENALGAESAQLQLIVAGYVLTFGLFLVPMGRLGDQRSRRLLFVIGLAVFTLASLAAALATDATMLLIARLVQGAAAGTQMPQVLGTIQVLFRGRARGRAFGLFGAVVGVSVALGPTLAGLLIAVGGAHDGWRWIFWMNVPLGLAAIGLVLWLLPETRERSRRRVDLDPVGVVLFAASVFALLWPFLFTTGAPDDNPARWWLLLACAVLVALFVLWERWYAAHGRQPLLPGLLMRIGSFRNGTVIQAAYFAATPAMLLLTTLYLQIGLDVPPVFAGMVSIGFALTNAVGSWVAGTLVGRFGRTIVVWGLVVVLLTLVGLTVVVMVSARDLVPYAMAAVLTVSGIGGGLVISPNQTLTLAQVPVAQGGLAGSVGQLGQRIGTAIGSAIALALFYATIYRENDGRPKPDVFHDAFLFGMISVIVFGLIAFAVALADLGQRRRSAQPPTP
ncbi:MFS transporter [Microbacterium sp. X-17]|uniref:MFS transporter n=1 Tax=Microbacterium sp. X-17 TaxID=3144404 RepID=UPI0031F4BD4F